MSSDAQSEQSAAHRDLFVLHQSRKWLIETLDSLSDEQLTHAPVEGGNHALWTMGHLAFADEFFLTKLGNFEATLPAGWAEQFGWGHPCSPNADDFPAISEVREALLDQRAKLLDWLNSLSAEELDAPTGADWEDFSPTLRALISGAAVHEGTHLGQVMVVRKSLKLPPLSL